MSILYGIDRCQYQAALIWEPATDIDRYSFLVKATADAFKEHNSTTVVQQRCNNGAATIRASIVSDVMVMDAGVAAAEGLAKKPKPRKGSVKELASSFEGESKVPCTHLHTHANECPRVWRHVHIHVYKHA